jgi:LPXTG-site transpeptidase (sortase) family protein
VEENVETNTQEKTKDAADLTQEIYNINGPIGTLYIPKTGLNTQIYSNVTVDEMESMPCFLYTTGGLNKKGVTLFVGHNRRNGKIFSDNNNLENGDKFYFKDLDGTELEYTVYSKFVTTENDTSFLNDDVDSPTIALSCCTDDDDDYRIIILGRADN